MIYRCTKCRKRFTVDYGACPSCGGAMFIEEGGHKKKKSPLFGILIGVVAVAFISILPNTTESIINTLSSNNTKHNANTVTMPNSKVETIDTSNIMDEQNFRSKCIDASSTGYKELQRNSDKYIGANIKATLKVRSVVSSTNRSEFSCTEVGTGNEYTIIDNRDTSNTRILDGDIIDVFGVYQGIRQYEIMINGAEIYTPVIKAKYIDFLDEETISTEYSNLEVTNIKRGEQLYGYQYWEITLKNTGDNTLNGVMTLNLYQDDTRFDEFNEIVKALGPGESVMIDCMTDKTSYTVTRVTVSYINY